MGKVSVEEKIAECATNFLSSAEILLTLFGFFGIAHELLNSLLYR